MKDDLADALIPVFWARDHIPVLQERLLSWQRRYPYEVVAERDPVQADMDLVIARLRTPLDPLIIGDVGAIINSVRTGLDLMMAAVVARHVASPSWFPNFPICESRDDFLDAVGKLQSRYQLTADEADAIRRTKAYDGGDHLLWHIAKLDNLRKHQRLLVVEAIPIEAHVTQIYMVQRLMEHSHAELHAFDSCSGRDFPADQGQHPCGSRNILE
jgi:hypothetical protein